MIYCYNGNLKCKERKSIPVINSSVFRRASSQDILAQVRTTTHFSSGVGNAESPPTRTGGGEGGGERRGLLSRITCWTDTNPFDSQLLKRVNYLPNALCVDRLLMISCSVGFVSVKMLK